MDEQTLARQSGEWIRGAMAKYGVSVAGLAADAEMSPGRVGTLVSGGDFPSHVEVDLLSGALANCTDTPALSQGRFRNSLAEVNGYTSVAGRTSIPEGHPQALRQHGGHSTAGR
jgi:hypothetical protein